MLKCLKQNRAVPLHTTAVSTLQIFKEKTEKNQAIHSINRLFEILLEAWCKETAFPSCQKDYDFYNDPTYGQCAITAMLVCDMFGGTIHRVRVSGGGTHYLKKINNHYIGLTSDQIGRASCRERV